MQSDASTPAQYLRKLPPDRRAIVTRMRELILQNLPPGYVEAMSWGMLSYEIPLSIVPDTYNGKPLMYCALAAQKHYYAIYLMNFYADEKIHARLEKRFADDGKKLDAGKCCIRFKKIEALNLEAIAEVIRATPMPDFIAHYQATRGRTAP